MKLGVTGASGFVGRSLLQSLSAAGHSGVAISRRPVGDLPSGWIYQSRENVLRGGLELAVDIVIHLEVKQHVQNPSPSDFREFHSVNVIGTQQWLDWTEKNRINKFILFSSIKAAGASNACQSETSDSLPDTPYGESKLEAEKLVSDWAARVPSRTALILRPAVIYGPENQANILSLIDAIFRGRFLLVGKNDNIKSMISLGSLVSAVNHLLTLPLMGTHLFYLNDKESYSVSQIAQMISEILNKKPPRSLPFPLAKAIAFFGDAFVMITKRNFPLTTSRLAALLENTHFSSAKLQDTGFVHPVTTRQGLEEMVNWYLRTRGVPQP